MFSYPLRSPSKLTLSSAFVIGSCTCSGVLTFRAGATGGLAFLSRFMRRSSCSEMGPEGTTLEGVEHVCRGHTAHRKRFASTGRRAQNSAAAKDHTPNGGRRLTGRNPNIKLAGRQPGSDRWDGMRDQIDWIRIWQSQRPCHGNRAMKRKKKEKFR